MGKAWPALDIHVPGCDPQLQELVLAELDDFQPTAIQEPDDSSRLRAFFTTAESRDAAARALAASFGSHLFVESIDVEDEDWAARSQAQLRAITIGRLVVAPPGTFRTFRGLTPVLYGGQTPFAQTKTFCGVFRRQEARGGQTPLSSSSSPRWDLAQGTMRRHASR